MVSNLLVELTAPCEFSDRELRAVQSTMLYLEKCQLLFVFSYSPPQSVEIQRGLTLL